MTTARQAPSALPQPEADAGAGPGRQFLARLRRAPVFQDFKLSYELVTGLPLSLASEQERLAHRGERNENVFCAMMASRPESAMRCLGCQRMARAHAAHRPATRVCFAGLYETSVPIRLGTEAVGHLQVGQCRPRPVAPGDFAALVRQLQRWDARVDLKMAERAFAQTRVVEPKKYASMVQLLAEFSVYLSTISNQLMLTTGRPSRVLESAQRFISTHVSEPLTLAAVARAVQRKPSYCCRLFRRETGLGFVEFRTRTRIEKSKQLLLNSSTRVGEAAFAAGFTSLSQFNRSFKRIVGEQPTAWREKVAVL